MNETISKYAKQDDAEARVHELEKQLGKPPTTFAANTMISDVWQRIEVLEAIAAERGTKPVAVAPSAPKPLVVTSVAPPPVAKPNPTIVGGKQLTGLARAMAANAAAKEAK